MENSLPKCLFSNLMAFMFCVYAITIALPVRGAAIPSLSSPQRLYWGAVGGLYSSNLDGTDQKKLVDTGVYFPSGVDVDPQNHKLYWSTHFPEKGVYWANLDGTGRELIAPFQDVPSQVVVDSDRNCMYIVSDGLDTVVRSNLDGTNPTVVLSIPIALRRGLHLSAVERIDVDSSSGDIVLCGRNIIPMLWRVDRDFTSLETIATWTVDRRISPFAATVDVATGDVYWIEEISQSLRRTTPLGIESTIIPSGLAFGNQLTLDSEGRKLYWTSQQLRGVFSANLDGSGVRQIANGYIAPSTIAIGPGIPEPSSALLCAFALSLMYLRRTQVMNVKLH